MKRWIGILSYILALGCGGKEGPSPTQRMYSKVLRAVVRNREVEGIYVQVVFRTTAFELARLYAEADKKGWDKDQVRGKLRYLVLMFADSPYPSHDRGLLSFYQIYKALDPGFDPENPLQRAQYEVFRNRYVDKVVDQMLNPRLPGLRERYLEEWGYDLYGRLVFSFFLENRGGKAFPVRDIGERIFLEDDKGNRYRPSGLAGPYPYEYDRPKVDSLETTIRFRLFFVNRRSDGGPPIVREDTQYIKLVIENWGGRPVWEFRWDLPLKYPEWPKRKERPKRFEGA
ncbi:MAG TPA: hypothetical protein EYP17_06555 [Candidatus Latescibacteria bacterium]|nr:hypothetical protein [Candidatus Latescibacterota bacterium]